MRKVIKLSDELIKEAAPLFAKKNALRMMFSFLRDQCEALSKEEDIWWSKAEKEAEILPGKALVQYDRLEGEISFEEEE